LIRRHLAISLLKLMLSLPGKRKVRERQVMKRIARHHQRYLVRIKERIQVNYRIQDQDNSWMAVWVLIRQV